MQPGTAARQRIPSRLVRGGVASRDGGHPRGFGRAAMHRLEQRVRLLVCLSRPGQWSKNVLVLAAPAAAGSLTDPSTLRRTAVALLSFTVASVAVYAANDVHDAAADRAHPDKRRRPVASGAVSTRTALTWSGTCALVSLTLAATLGTPTLAVVACYLTLSGGYALWLKNQPVLDVMAVAAGFVLRALAGATANHLAASNWFLLVSLFGALYLVVGKRASEAARLSSVSEPPTRTVLTQYPTTWLQQMLTVSLAGAMLSYAMWAFQTAGTDVFKPLLALSVVPFLVALMRYGLLLSRGDGERPEHLVTADRMLLVAGLLWSALVAAALYAA